MGESDLTRTRPESLDEFTLALRGLRDSTGLSYRSIAAIISERRGAAGSSPAASKIAHTTVADAFQLGRSRVNPSLVFEIVQALGLDATESRKWSERCVAAMSPPRERVPDPPPTHPPLSRDEPALQPSAHRSGSALSTSVALVGVGLVLNATGKFLNPLFGDVFFLDMIGTAVVALLLGPWWSALVGAIFAVVELMKGNVGNALFATTMITSGLLWGYGSRRWGLADSLPRFLGLSILVALTTSALAVPITVLYFDGEPGRGLDGYIDSLTRTGANLWVVVGMTNLAVSTADKAITGVVAFYLAQPLGRLLRVSGASGSR